MEDAALDGAHEGFAFAEGVGYEAGFAEGGVELFGFSRELGGRVLRVGGGLLCNFQR